MKKYGKYFIELIVIVVGITLSFMVDEWREENQKRKDIEKSLKLMLENLKADSLEMATLNYAALKQSDLLKLLIQEKPAYSESLIFDLYFATWSVQSQITIQKSALENLNNITGLYFNTEGFQNILDHYYNFTVINNELTDWHLSNQRIDDIKWLKLDSFNELALIMMDSIENDNSQIKNNSNLTTDLIGYFNDQNVKNLLSDKLLMASSVAKYLQLKLEENQRLKLAIIKEL